MKTFKHLVISLMLLLLASYIQAQTPNYLYYVPLPEQQIHNCFTVLYSGTGTTYHTVVSIVPSTTGSIIYYDQWEDGYEANLGAPVQSTTLVYGDNNPANGIPPGYATDKLVAGKPLILENDLTLPRDPAQIKFDGRDRIGCLHSLALSRSSWALNPGTVLTDATEFYNTKSYGTFYYIPIGQNTSSDNMFQLTALHVQASENATTVQIDKDGNGSVDVTTVINKGESYQVNGGVMVGATVNADKPVQVVLITGRIGATYESRWYTIMPSAIWDKNYFTPVGTTNANGRSDVFFFNPTTSSLTVTCEVKGSVTTASVPAKGNYRFSMPLNSSAHFHAPQNFYAVGAVDADPTDNQTWDWGYTLLPGTLLTNSIYVGWGVGSVGNPIPYNGSPVWIGSVEDSKKTTVYVDLDGNPATGVNTDINGNKYDYTIVLDSYSIATIYDPDKNQTGVHLYTLDGTNVSAAWGEDPSVAGPGNPYIDAGTTIPPDPQFRLGKFVRLAVDNNHNNLVDGGDELIYTLNVFNQTIVPITDVHVYDTLEPTLTYVPGSTQYNTVPVADNISPDTPFPLDQGGLFINILGPNTKDSITFHAIVKSPLTFNTIHNKVTATTGDGDTAKAEVRIPTDFATTPCHLDFTNSIWVPVSSYNENATIYISVADTDNNINPLAKDSVPVTVTSTGTLDSELKYLIETGVNTGIFRGSIPSSKSSGSGNNNGLLYTSGGNTLTVTYTDLIFGGTCTDNAPVIGPSLVKQLYLSDSLVAQGLDRVRPWDLTAATSAVLSLSSTVTYDNYTTTVTDGNVSSKTVNITVGSGLNRLMLVGISIEHDAPSTIDVTSVYLGTTLMSKVGEAPESGEAQAEIWSLINPPSGVQTVKVNFTGGAATDAVVIGVADFSGVNQSTPLDAAALNSGNSNTGSVTVTTGATGDLIFGVLAYDDARAITTVTTGGQVEIWNVRNIQNATTDGITGGGSTKPGASSVTLSWNLSSGPDGWSAIGVPINAAPATATASFTQTPPMCSNLTLTNGGQVKVKLWLTNITGTMPANPNILAVLKNNGSAFVTVTNPSFTDNTGTANDTLVFTGVLSGTQTILANNSLSMDVTTSQAGVSFRVAYDALSSQSRIDLPASNVIKITSLAVYSAAYSGGSILTEGTNGLTYYVRATVTDPFGSYDAAGMDLRITDPLLNYLDVTMTPVATSGCTKTFEYAWITGTNQGNYSLRAIAKEGMENKVKDTAYSAFKLIFLDTGTPCTLDFTDGSYNPVTSYAPNASICVQLKDLDQNLNSLVAETVHVTVSSNSGDSENMTLTETGVNTGIFFACIPSSATVPGSNNNGTLYAAAGASILADYTDPQDPSDICSDNALITTAGRDVTITKTRLIPGSGICVVGDSVKWQITISNPGPTALTSATVTDTYSTTCLTFQYSSPNYTTYVPATGTLTWSLAALGGNILPGQIRTITVTFLAASYATCSPTINTASVTANDGGTPMTPPSVTSPVTITYPHLSISKTKTSPADPIYVGMNITYDIVVTNTGNTVATIVPLTDTYSDFNFQYITSTLVPTSAGSGLLLWSNIGPINVGASKTITVTFKALNGNLGAFVYNNVSVNFASDINGNTIPSVDAAAAILVFYPPVAVDDFNSTLVNTPVSGTVISNDYDNDGDVLTVTPYTGPTPHGSVVLNSDGTYTYTPAPGYIGTDSFTYTICDPTNACDTAVVTITIVKCFDPPVRPGNIIKN
jgi:large repetitive protein